MCFWCCREGYVCSVGSVVCSTLWCGYQRSIVPKRVPTRKRTSSSDRRWTSKWYLLRHQDFTAQLSSKQRLNSLVVKHEYQGHGQIILILKSFSTMMINCVCYKSGFAEALWLCFYQLHRDSCHCLLHTAPSEMEAIWPLNQEQHPQKVNFRV